MAITYQPNAAWQSNRNCSWELQNKMNRLWENRFLLIIATYTLKNRSNFKWFYVGCGCKTRFLIILFESRIFIECIPHGNSSRSVNKLIKRVGNINFKFNTNRLYSQRQQIHHVTGSCYELLWYSEVNVNSIKFLKKKEDCSTPSGLSRNEPDRSFLVRIEAKKLH